MTDEEKRFDRREEARLDDMYDAQCEPEEEDEMKPTDKQVVEWAREARVANAWDINWFDPYYASFAALAYEAGREDERERILDMCKEGLWDGEGIKFHLDKQGENND